MRMVFLWMQQTCRTSSYFTWLISTYRLTKLTLNVLVSCGDSLWTNGTTTSLRMVCASKPPFLSIQVSTTRTDPCIYNIYLSGNLCWFPQGPTESTRGETYPWCKQPLMNQLMKDQSISWNVTSFWEDYRTTLPFPNYHQPGLFELFGCVYVVPLIAKMSVAPPFQPAVWSSNDVAHQISKYQASTNKSEASSKTRNEGLRGTWSTQRWLDTIKSAQYAFTYDAYI